MSSTCHKHSLLKRWKNFFCPNSWANKLDLKLMFAELMFEAWSHVLEDRNFLIAQRLWIPKVESLRMFLASRTSLASITHFDFFDLSLKVQIFGLAASLQKCSVFGWRKVLFFVWLKKKKQQQQKVTWTSSLSVPFFCLFEKYNVIVKSLYTIF